MINPKKNLKGGGKDVTINNTNIYNVLIINIRNFYLKTVIPLA